MTREATPPDGSEAKCDCKAGIGPHTHFRRYPDIPATPPDGSEAAFTPSDLRAERLTCRECKGSGTVDGCERPTPATPPAERPDCPKCGTGVRIIRQDKRGHCQRCGDIFPLRPAPIPHPPRPEHDPRDQADGSSSQVKPKCSTCGGEDKVTLMTALPPHRTVYTKPCPDCAPRKEPDPPRGTCPDAQENDPGVCYCDGPTCAGVNKEG